MIFFNILLMRIIILLLTIVLRTLVFFVVFILFMYVCYISMLNNCSKLLQVFFLASTWLLLAIFLKGM